MNFSFIQNNFENKLEINRKLNGSGIYRSKKRPAVIKPIKIIVLYKKPCIKLKAE